MKVTIRATFWKGTDDFKEIVIPNEVYRTSFDSKTLTFLLGQKMHDVRNLLWIENMYWLMNVNSDTNIYKRVIDAQDIFSVLDGLLKWRNERIELHRSWGCI